MTNCFTVCSPMNSVKSVPCKKTTRRSAQLLETKIYKKFFFPLFYNQEIGARTDGSYLLLPLNSYWNISFSLSLILFLCVSGNNLQTKDDLQSCAKTRFWLKPLLPRLVCIKYFNETEVPHYTQSVSILSVQKATKTVRGVMRLNYGVLSIFSK